MEKNIITTLKNSLYKTSNSFINKLSNIFKNKKNENILEEIEELLLKSDIGFSTTEKILTILKKKNIINENDLLKELFNIMHKTLKNFESKLIVNESKKPFLIIMVGINGSGKTTTIGKLTYLLKKNNKKIILAAGDTYRKGSIEQLESIALKLNTQIVKQTYGADSAAVIFDAFQKANKNNIDILIADTAGRLHTNNKLLEKLKKITNVVKKLDENAPHEVLLVIDATLGQNSIRQAKIFNENINIDGIIITKLDGTAKAGSIFSIVEETKIPIKYICYGEQFENIMEFEAKKFVNSILNTNF